MVSTMRHSSQQTHYEVLGLESSCTTKELRDAYMTMSKKLHPDLAPGSHTQFVQLNEAYQTLSRPHRRAMYDAGLRRTRMGPPPPGHPHWTRGGWVETTGPGEKPFWDSSIYSMRDRSADGGPFKPYYGIRGLKKTSNWPIAVFCLLFMGLGIIVQTVAIKSTHEKAASYIDKKNQRLFSHYMESKNNAIDTKDKSKLEHFLKSRSVKPTDLD